MLKLPISKILFLLPFLCLASAMSVCGQEPITTQVNMEVTLYLPGARARGAEASLDRNIRKAQTVYYVSNGSIQSIKISPGRKSPSFQYVGDPKFQLFRSKGIDEAGNPILSPITTTQLPFKQNRTLITLFLEGSHWHAFPLDLEKTPLHKNTARFFNLSPQKIALRTGDEKFILPPYQSRSVSLKSVKADLQLEIQLATQNDNSWQLVYSGAQTVKKEHYYIFLLTPDDDGKSYRIIRFKA